MEQSSAKLQQGSCQFIAVAAHTFAWYNRIDTKCHENVKLSLKRDNKQRRKKHKQLAAQQQRIYTLWEKKKKSTSVSKCKWCCQDWKDGWDIKRSPLWVTCIRRTSMEFLCIQKHQTSFCMTAADFVWHKIRIPQDSFPILAVHHRKSYSLLHCSTL